MIRQNDQRDQFSSLKYGSVISYPSGKKHVYKDYLIVGKTDNDITTVPLIKQKGTVMNRFDVPLSDSLNADLGDSYFSSTLNVNTIKRVDYDRVNSIHILDLDPREIKTHDQKTSVQIALARKQYHAWLSIEQSNMPITRKHQALRRGLNKHRILTQASIQQYLIGAVLTGSTKNTDYNLASYVDQTYLGSIAKNDPHANEQACLKFANVDKLRKYDIIRYKAITGDRVKWRPFLVMGQNGNDVDLVPITHSRHDGLHNDTGLYTIYHVNLSPNISKAISIMNGDGRGKAELNRSALSPCTQITVNLETFKKKQLPQYLGNLTDYVNRDEITQMEHKKNDTIKALMTSYENYQIEEKALHRVKNYQIKLHNRQSISPRDLQKIISRKADGRFSKEVNLSPAIDHTYLALKAKDQLIYGVYQNHSKLKNNFDSNISLKFEKSQNVTNDSTEIEI